MKGVSKQTMADLITFIYTGEVNVDSKSLADFLQTTKELKIKGLAGIQEQKIKSGYNKPARNGVQFQTTQINNVQRSKTANNNGNDSAYAYELPYQPLSEGSTTYVNDFNFEHSSGPDDE